MKTYLLPVTFLDTNHHYNKQQWYACVYANSTPEAYNNTIKLVEENISHNNYMPYHIDTNESHYEIYDTEIHIKKPLFPIEEKCDMLNIIFNKMTYQGDSSMTDILYDTIYMRDYNKNLSDLANMALPETWTSQFDENNSDNSILKKYLSKTLERLQDENKVVTTDKFCAFNTGLFTTNYESIYLLAEKYNSQKQNWIFKEFCTEYKFASTDIITPPERANYFSDPSLLLFDWHYPVRVQYGHILDDDKSRNRLPKCISESKMKLQLFIGAIDTSIKKVIANYKLAVPQYYEKQIQLLIPLFFEDENKPDLALAVTKKDGYYQGHTCLTLDMAYNNARLIAKPETNWLIP